MTTTNAVLFDGLQPGGKKRAAKPRRAQPPAPERAKTVIAAMMHYAERYAARFHESPNTDKKDWVLMKRLIQKYGAEKVRARIEAFLLLDDEFIAQRTGYTIPAFFSNWDRLCSQIAAKTKVAGAVTPIDCAHEPRCKTAVEHGRKALKDLERHGSSRSRTT